MRPPHPAPLLKPTGPRFEVRGSRFDLVDLVPRYPTIENEVDERAADLVDLAQNMGAQPLSQIHRIDARAPINCMSFTSWRNNRDGSASISRAGQPQGDHKTRSRIDNIPCYQWPKDRITRLGSLGYRVNPPRLNPN